MINVNLNYYKNLKPFNCVQPNNDDDDDDLFTHSWMVAGIGKD